MQRHRGKHPPEPISGVIREEMKVVKERFSVIKNYKVSKYPEKWPRKWGKIKNQNYAKLLKNPPSRIRRICHTNVNRASYSDDPFATLDRFGKKIFFGSNWGTPFEKGGDIDVYQVELPSNCYEDLMG